MRIALLCPTFGEYGGIGRIAEALGREFVQAGHPVAFISRPGAAVRDAWRSHPRLELRMHQAPRSARHVARQARLMVSLVRARPLLHRFLREQADVVLTLAISTFAPWGLLAAREKPVVVSLQGGEPDGRFVSHPRLFRALLARASGVGACAESLARSARALDPSLRVPLEVIPNGVDVDFFSATPRTSSSRAYLLAAGRFTPQKGFDVLLAAAARVDAVRRGNLDLVVAGDGRGESELLSSARRLGIAERVQLPGAVDASTLRRLYQGAVAVVVPSRWEGLPLVCLEAMASARPVIASRVDGIPDAVVDEETGLLVPADDADMLTAAIERVLADPAWAERLGAAGAKRARTRFAWPIVAARYLGLLARAVPAVRP